jgi:hypothetical protein
LFTLSDIHTQAEALQTLPPVEDGAFLPAAVGLLERFLAQPPEGMRPGWPASRRWNPLGYDRADDSAFYPANLVYLLQALSPKLEPGLAARVGILEARIRQQYGLYRSVPGLWSYAFYQTRPQKRWFPYGNVFGHEEHFRPPDDPDDTALIYLTHPHSEEQKDWLREVKLPAHAGQNAGPVPHTRPEWQGLRAYTTFFAQAMPLSFDVGVLANVMNWILGQTKTLNVCDIDSLRILSDTIKGELILTDPYRIAPYYAHPVGLGYTLARFLAAHPEHPFVEEHRPVLIKTLQKLEADARQSDLYTGFERLAVQNALSMLGVRCPTVPVWTAKEAGDFSLYRFPLAAEYKLILAQYLAPRDWLSVRFSSPTFALGLLMERSVGIVGKG